MSEDIKHRGLRERGVKDLVEVLASDARDGFGASESDRGVARHVDRHAQRRSAGAHARARLEHPEPLLLDGEFDVAHVAKMRFEAREHVA